MERERRPWRSRRRGRQRTEYSPERQAHSPRSSSSIRWMPIVIGSLLLFGVGRFFFSQPSFQTGQKPQSAGLVYDGQSARLAKKQLAFEPAKIKDPKIDLKAVEHALWETKTSDPKDFKGWMKKFEDEVNAIYFATLKQQNPKADPTTLLPEPVRVDPQRISSPSGEKLLHLYGYIDKNKQPGFQNTEDSMLFAFKQSKPYNAQEKKLQYSLYDSSGYYHRSPDYMRTITSALVPVFIGFFVYSAWKSMWWRSSFMWHQRPGWWSRGTFSSRYNHYYNRYPSYRRSYRSTYYTRHRPRGWSQGSNYRRSGGKYFPKSRYRSGSSYRRSSSRYRGNQSLGRSRYRSGSSSYRSRSSRGSGYRSRGGFGGKY